MYSSPFQLAGSYELSSILITLGASSMAFPAVRAARAHSAKVPLGILGISEERDEGNPPSIKAEGTMLSGLSVSLQAITARPSRNSFLSFNLST